MCVSSPAISQVATITSPSYCHCCRCGDVIPTCCLKSRPSSCEPSLQRVESAWFMRKAEVVLDQILVGEKLERSRRKSEEALSRFWEDIDLSEPDRPFWWPFLPRWVADDVVIQQIGGLGRLPNIKDEGVAERCDRLMREYEEREKLHPTLYPPSMSPSSFTSYEGDTPRLEDLEAPVHRRSSEQILITDPIPEENSFPSSSPSVPCDPTKDTHGVLLSSPVEYFWSKNAKRGELKRHRNSQTNPFQQGDSFSPLSDSLDRSIVIDANHTDSSYSTSPSKLSTRMTTSPSSESTHLSEENFSFNNAHLTKLPNTNSTTIEFSVNPPSGHALVTPNLSPREPEQFRCASTTKNNERGRQNRHQSLDHTTIGKRRRAVSCPPQPDAPSHDDDGPAWSVGRKKRVRMTQAL